MTLAAALVCIQTLLLLTQLGCLVHDIRHGGDALGNFAVWGCVPIIAITLVVLGLPV